MRSLITTIFIITLIVSSLLLPSKASICEELNIIQIPFSTSNISEEYTWEDLGTSIFEIEITAERVQHNYRFDINEVRKSPKNIRNITVEVYDKDCLLQDKYKVVKGINNPFFVASKSTKQITYQNSIVSSQGHKFYIRFKPKKKKFFLSKKTRTNSVNFTSDVIVFE